MADAIQIRHATPLLPGERSATDPTRAVTLGVMGGGQLGRMFVQAAQAMGYFTAVLEPDPASPAGLVAHWHTDTAYDDEQGLAQLMQRCDAITTEFENVPAAAMERLARERFVAPGAAALAIAQDRALEKVRTGRRQAARTGACRCRTRRLERRRAPAGRGSPTLCRPTVAD